MNIVKSAMLRSCLVAAFLVAVPGRPMAAQAAAHGHETATVTADAALAELKAGNQRHIHNQYRHPHEGLGRRESLVKGQQPHAVVLSCADSRVPPEIVFDQGLGDLFTVRVAGNIADDVVIGSIEYAAEHLHTPLVVVLGHESCGAVTAATEKGPAPGHLPALVDAIQPAVEKARSEPGDLLANAVRENVVQVVGKLRSSSPILGEMVSKGELRVVGAVYSLHSGEVTWLP
jgi:carbonic anhydrase